MFGMLIYHAMTGSPYWNADTSDGQVSSILADPRKLLPHESNPLPEPVHVSLQSHRLSAHNVATSGGIHLEN